MAELNGFFSAIFFFRAQMTRLPVEVHRAWSCNIPAPAVFPLIRQDSGAKAAHVIGPKLAERDKALK